MPRKPKRPCGHQGCPNLTNEYYCDKHRKEYAKHYNHFERDPKTAERYGGAWRKIRAKFLAAYPLCELCKQSGKYVPADTVRRKCKVADSGMNDWSNLQALCRLCHSSVHAEQGDDLNRK